MKKTTKILTVIFTIFVLIIGLSVLSYTTIIPALVSNEQVQEYAIKKIKKSFDADVIITKPLLETGFSTYIKFSVENLSINKKDKKIVEIKNFKSEISWEKIFAKDIIIKQVGADSIFIDADELIKLLPQDKQEDKKKSDWHADLFYSLLYIKKCIIFYSPNENVKLKLYGKNLEITNTRNPKYVKFDIKADIIKNNKILTLNLSDKNKVYFKDRTFTVKDCDFYINNSKILINYVAQENNNTTISLKTDNFKFEDVISIIDTKILMPSGTEFLDAFKNINGNFSFDVKIADGGITGKFKIKKLAFQLVAAKNLPVVFNQGIIDIDKNKILLWKINGYYGKSKRNKMTFNGKITDYMKSCNTKIEGYVAGTKELFDNYISPMAGIDIELVGQTVSKIKFNMINGKMDIAVIFRLLKGFDILVDGMSFTPTDYQRAFRADMTLDGSNFELKNFNYYIANSFKAGVVVTPLLKIFGNFDLSNNAEIKNIGFELTKPLPSEFFNLFIRQKLFKKGKIGGSFEYIATSDIPYLKGNMDFTDVRIPSQRFSVKKGSLYTDKDNIILDMNGKYRRTEFTFDGYVANQMKLPIIVKKADLNIPDLDIEKIIQSLQRQQEREAELAKTSGKTVASSNDENNNDAFVFAPDVIVIENSALKVVKGAYKQIKYANINAVMTLNKDGVLDIQSNKFDIAEGISTLHVVCDLFKQRYKMRLGLKDVNSDIIASSLLNLQREISGKARCLLLIDTDSSMKLNGSMKFDIKNGTIAKVGLIEYALNFVSLFRNPLAMISPATFVDLVNVPEGKFNTIEGSLILKDNSIDRMMIKSQAPQLSSFIIGKYDIEKSDAILRIYTKFSNKHKGMAGFFRNISLNSLANTIPLSNKNESNYYASELQMLPEIDADEKDCQVFLTKIDGDVEKNNFLSSLKRIK